MLNSDGCGLALSTRAGLYIFTAMDEPVIPESAERLANRLKQLKEQRRLRQAKSRAERVPRRSLAKIDRQKVLAKTDNRCHICGGRVLHRWQADHVLAHSDGGPHSVENYLAAHALCNNYRWDYSPEEFQWIIKVGVWAKSQMEGASQFSLEILKRFFDYEQRRVARRVRNPM